MTINTDLLVSAAMLQDYLVDKDTGMPLANGIISLYKDTSRSLYKNWYYQTGTPGAYTWIALDNPLRLSSVGTIQDPYGNDVIPFYYPFEEDNENISEPYYITVYSADENGDQDILQFTRENFPHMPSNFSPDAQNPTWRNYIVNNVYWNNINALDAMNETDVVIAPSQHEGYTNPDIRFIKNVTGANDDLAFLPMTETLDNDITPEQYIHFQCSGTQAGETVKCIQYPISLHVKTLQNHLASLVIHAQNVAGSANNFLDLYIYQFLGTGALTQPDPILIQRITLTNSFQKFVIPFIFPDAEGLTLGSGNDDALFLRVQYPLSALCDINHTKPQIYLSVDVPDNDFDTYDDIVSIIDSPRTADYRLSLRNSLSGYVKVQDDTIGSFDSAATTKTNDNGFNSTFPLYKFLWDNVNNAFAPVSTGRGASAYADYTANKTLGLPKALGRVLMGLPTSSTFTYDHLTSTLTLASTAFFYQGAPVILSNSGGALPAAFTAGTVYYCIPLSPTTMQLASTYGNAISRTAVAAGADDGTGTQTASFALGGEFGQSDHTIPNSELPDPLGTPDEVEVQAAAPGVHVIRSINTAGAGVIKNDPSGFPANIVQPSTYANIFLKL